MRTYLISYDLSKPELDKHVVAKAIMSVGASWARPLDQTWYVRTEEAEDTIASCLWGLLDDEDGLVIQAVKEEAVLMNTSLRWFRKRLPAYSPFAPPLSLESVAHWSRAERVLAYHGH